MNIALDHQWFASDTEDLIRKTMLHSDVVLFEPFVDNRVIFSVAECLHEHCSERNLS